MTSRNPGLLFFLLLAVLSPAGVAAQAATTVKDAAEISYKSELLLGELRDLLNIISNNETDLKETKELIYNSHSGEKNRIFFTGRTLIENDLSPQIHATADAGEITIDKYLNDLDLLYHKSDTPSIRFENIRISNLKKGEYLYVKAYYHSRFLNKANQADSGYATNDRVAEIRADKESNKWQLRIVHLGFFDKRDTLAQGPDSTDVALAYEPANGPASGGSDTVNAAETEKARERARQVEAYRKEQERYDQLLEKGDRAMTGNDYTAALNAFSEASAMSPYELYPKGKIRQIRQVLEQVKLSADELYDRYLEKGRIAEKARQYELAKEYYTEAQAKKPGMAGNIDDRIRALTEKIRLLTEPGEKYHAGLYKDAIKDYDRAIKKDNSNSDFYLGRGKCYDALGEINRALKDYDQAYNLDNNNLPAIRLRAELYARKGDYFKALTDYKVYATIDKTDTSIFLRTSELHIQIGNLNNALEDLDRVLVLNNRHAGAYYQKGLLLYRQQKLKEASDNFTCCIGNLPVHPNAYYQRGLCNMVLGLIAAAGKDFDTARRQGLEAGLVNQINNLAMTYYQQALKSFAAGRTDIAQAWVDSAIAINPLHPESRFTKGECYYFRNDFRQAIDQFTDAIALNQRYYEALYKRAMAKCRLQNYREAIPDGENAVGIKPHEPLTYKLLGDAHYHLQRYDSAIDWYARGLECSQTNKIFYAEAVLADLYNNYGMAYFETGDFTHALDLFKNAVRRDKSLAIALYNRGNTYLRLNRLAEAGSDISKALLMEPKHAGWYYSLGLVSWQKKDRPDAIVQFSQAIAHDSLAQWPLAYYKRGECYYQEGTYQEALPDYLACRCNGSDSGIAEFAGELGTTYLRLGKTDSARVWLDEATRRDSSSAAAWYGLACVYVQCRQPDWAMNYFEKAFSKGTIKYGMIKKDPLIASVKDDKRFRALVKKYL